MIVMTPVEGREPIRKVWPFVKDYIQTAVNRNPDALTMDDLAEGILSGNLSLWVPWDSDEKQALGFVICEAKGGVGTIKLIGGRNRARWIERLDIIADTMRAKGVKTLTATLPRGWARDMKAFSMRRYEVVMTL